MREVVQNLRSGETTPTDVPAPQVNAGQVLVRTCASLISAGSERMLVEFGRAGWLDKAREQPDKVHQVLEKMRTDGFLSTLESVRHKLDQPLALGYCNVGVVERVGAGVEEFSVGDRVASNGPHAEIVSVPHTLCASIPEGVSDDAASFTPLAAVALQGTRLAGPTLGECFVVTGLGLIGQLAVQLLRAQGCRVLGVDLDESRLALARRFGAEAVNAADGENLLAAAERFSRGRGVDGVILALSSDSNEPVRQAARMCRKRGRIVLVGVVGLEFDRADFYEKEISFQVSCSYGPGRYDPTYEEKGQDYPVGFVRWTAQRNFEAVLDMMATGRLDPTPLITHRFPLDRAREAYDLLTSDREPSLGILLEYPEEVEAQRTIALRETSAEDRSLGAGGPLVGVVGAGNHASRVLLPALRRAGVRFHGIASVGGRSAARVGRKFGFIEATTDPEALIRDRLVNTVVIATRHDSHARFVIEALQAGKHVFVEKPLALTLAELADIEEAWRASRRGDAGSPLLMVGFNRRFSPLVRRMRSLLARLEAPKSFIITVNAGDLPADHWTQDVEVGGGRIVGEACHFIDLMRHLAVAPIVNRSLQVMGPAEGVAAREDKAAITLGFRDGSFGTIHYLANGHRAFPKERIEVFCRGRVLQLENFRKLRGWGWPAFRSKRLWRQDKGGRACIAAFIEAVRSGAPSPIPFEELRQVSEVAVQLGEAARSRRHATNETLDLPNEPDATRLPSR